MLTTSSMIISCPNKFNLYSPLHIRNCSMSANSSENPSSILAIRPDSSQPAQLQKLVRILKVIDVVTNAYKLHRNWTTKALIGLCDRSGWSAAAVVRIQLTWTFWTQLTSPITAIHVLLCNILIIMNHYMWFPTMWHFDKCRLQPPFKLRNSKWCSFSSLTLIEYSSDLEMLWPDCAYAQAGLRLCWSHKPHCWKPYVVAQLHF